jgi:hypothetical protein
MLNDLWKWAGEHFTRKFTVPWHISGGLICALLYPHYSGLSITLFIAFGLFELWQSIVNFILYMHWNISWNRKDDEGYLDFWDFILGAFIGAIILLVAR